MNKRTLLIITVALVASLFGFSTVAAYTGVDVQTYDTNGDPWVHGGTVYLIGTTGGTPNSILNGAGSALDLNGEASIAWTAVPDNGTNVTIVIVFNNGGNGTPSTQQFTDQFTQFTFIPGQYNLQANTATGPLSISLQGVGGSAGTMPVAAAIAALLLAGMTFVVIRRRNA